MNQDSKPMGGQCSFTDGTYTGARNRVAKSLTRQRDCGTPSHRQPERQSDDDDGSQVRVRAGGLAGHALIRRDAGHDYCRSTGCHENALSVVP